MSRIRSIHPGIWTDEDFVELSMPARLFLIGLWGEADDYGVFEWKPLRLKMRLAPIDDIDAAALLSEIARKKQIVPIMRGDKHYGVIKNFRKFQRPKNPSAPIIPLDQEINGIVGLPLGDIPTPDLPQATPLPTEIPPQMEDGIGGDKGGGVDVRAILPVVGKRILEIMRVDTDPRWTGNYSLAEVWLRRGCDPDLDIYPTVERLIAQNANGPPIISLKYFDRAVTQAHADRNRILPEPSNANRSNPQKPTKPTQESDRRVILETLGVASGYGGMDGYADDPGATIDGEYRRSH